MEERKVYQFNPEEFRQHIAGQIPDFDPAQNDIHGPLTDIITPESVLYQRETNQIPDIAPMHAVIGGINEIFEEYRGFPLPDPHREKGVIDTLPRASLVGTKKLSDYRRNRLRTIDKVYRFYRENGASARETLNDYPAIVLRVPPDVEHPEEQLFILQGNEMVRRAGAKHIDHIPSEIFSPEQIAKMFNRQPDTRKHGRYTAGLITSAIRQQGKVAEISFKKAPTNRERRGRDSFGRIVDVF